MSAFDDNFAYALVSSSERTLQITGVNPSKYNAFNLSWGGFPEIPALYAGTTVAYNGYGTLENAFSVVEIANGAFNGRTEFAEGGLVLPNTLVRIGDSAFNGVKITGRLTIPASVTTVGASAFANTLIDELVVENETTSDMLSGVLDTTRVASKETAARIGTDASLSTLKVTKANPTFTGTTTIPNALISATTITNATVNTANITTNVTTNVTVDYYEDNVSVKNKNSRFQVLTTAGNLLLVGGVNENAAPIEIVLSNGIYRTGDALVGELLAKLNAKNISWVGGSQITWSGTGFDSNANAIKLAYSTAAPGTITDPTIVIRTKFVSNGVSYNSSNLLGAMGAMVGSVYENGAFVLAYGNRYGFNFPQPINLSVPTLTVNGVAKLDGPGTVSGNWNFIGNKPRHNAEVLATESYTQSKIQIINRSSILSTATMLADIASAIDADPNFAVNALASQASIVKSIASIASVRSTSASSLSTALSTQMSALQSVDLSLSGALSTTIPPRVSQMESVSTLLQTTVSGMQQSDAAMSTAMSGATSNRSSQTRSLSSAISTATSLLQNADAVISGGVSTATLNRSLNVSTNASTWSAQVSALETADATLSTSIVNVASARISSAASLSSLGSATVTALQSADATFSTALSTQTTDRNAAVATLSGAVSTQVSATRSMNAAILPQIMASASAATTSTVFNLVGVTVGQSVTFVKSGDSTFSNGDKIVITYSATDYLKGTVTAVAGSSVTLNVTFKATSASETTIYTTTGPYGASVASSTGDRTVSLSNPVFVAGSNFVVTSMTGTLFSSTDTGTYSVNLMDASNAVIATSLSKTFNASQTVETHEFVTAFLLKGATNLKQNFLHSAGKSTQIIVNFSDQNAHTTMKGYAVPYTGGAVQVESNGTLQSTRISAMDALSTQTRNALGTTATSTVFNLPRLSIGQSLTCFVHDMMSFPIGGAIKIVYSETDFIKGNVTAVNGYNVTFEITEVGTNKTVATIYAAPAAQYVTGSTTRASFLVDMPRSQNIVIDNIHPAFMSYDVGYVYGIIKPSGNRISLNSTDTYVGSGGYAYSASPIRWYDAFVPAQQTFQIEYVSTVAIQFPIDVSSNARQLILDGYTTSYTTGTVTMINPDVATIATARSVAVSSIVEVAAQSANSLQIVTAGISAAISVASSERNARVSSLSVQMTNNVATLSSTAASISAALSTQISNRSSQVLTAMTSLVGAAPASLDTLFEIATTLDAGPALYSTISATETALAANIGAGAVASVSASLSAAASTLQLADATLSAGISSATSDRISRVASVSAGMSAFISSTHSTHTSVSLGVSTTASVRQTGVNSISTLLSGMATALQSADSLASNSIVAATSARQSGIASASVLRSNTVLGLQTADTALSSGISTATSARQSGVNSVSGTLSSTVLAQASSIASLSSVHSTLNGGINLSTLANMTEVDSAIGQVLGVGTVSALDTLNEFALAVNNNASIGTALENAIIGKANQSDVALLSDEVRLKATQTDLTQLVNTVGTKANDALVTQLQTALSSMGSTVNVGISSEVQSLQSNMTINSEIFGLLSDTIRQVDTLYVYNGFMNPNGTINYKLNKLSNMVLQSSSLAFTIDANYAVTKITQVIAMKFDSTQTTVKYSSRGVEYPVSFTGGAHTFSIDSSNATDYANNATAIVFTMNESATRFAPDNSPFTVPKLAIAGYVYAAPTVQTPYAATTWSDATGKISQVIAVNFESGVQRLQIDGTVYDVTGTTQLVHTLEYLPGADPAGAVVVKALNSNAKLESATLTLNNVYNDYPKHAAPAEVGGSKTVTVSGSTYTHAVTYSTTASTVELQTYNVETSAYTSSELAVVGGQVSVSLTHAVGQIGQPLFKLRAKTGNGKRTSEFTSANGEAITFSKPVQSNVSYTTLSAGSYRVTATYEVHSVASAVKVINPSTAGTYIASQVASGGSVTFSIDYTETQVTNNAISFVVITLVNSYGLQSVASDAFVPVGQYDSPTYANDGSKTIMLNEGGSEYTYSANHNSLSTSGINVYNPDNSFVQTVTGTSPFAVTKTYGIDKIGQVVFKLSSKESATKRESALIDVVGEDIPIYSEPVMSGQITYGINGANYTAQMNYGVNHRVEALVALKSDGTALPNGTSIQQSIVSTTGTSRIISITVTIPNSIGVVNMVVRSAGNGYGKTSANSQTLTLIPQFEAPTTSGSITYSGNTATMSYTVAPNVTEAFVKKPTDQIYSVNSITNRQILPNFPVLGEKKTWTYTLNAATGDLGLTRKSPSSYLPFAMDIRSDRVVMGHFAGTWGGEQTIMTGFHNLARPLTFTVSFDGSYFLISYDNNTKTARYPNYQNITSVDEIKDSTNISNGTWSGPVVERFSSRWEMQIAFNNTGNNNSWRGLIGNVYNGLNDGANRAWGIWINNTNTIIVSPYSDSVLKAPTLWETALVVAQNVNYVFRVTKMLTTMTLSLTNLSTNAIQTSTLTLTASDIWGMHGSVTVGGWLAGFGPDSETFVGPITEVSVFPAFASSTVSGNSVTFAVPFLDAELPLSLVAVAKANSNGRVSVNSVVQNILSQYAVPIKASDPVYTESSGSYAATMTYTVTSGVTSLQVRRASDSSVVTGVTTSVTGITATITVPFTDALNFVVVALTNSSGRESAASVAQTILPKFAAPVLFGGIAYSGNTASMTYTVTSGVTVRVVKSDLSALPSDASVTTNTVSGPTATIAITFATSFSFVVIAEGNSSGRESAASTAQLLIPQFEAPTTNGSITYSGNTASMTYTVAPNVTEAFVKKPTDQIYSVNSITNRQILPNFPVLGEKKTWTYTLNAATGDLGLTRKSPSSYLPFAMDIRSDRVVMGHFAGTWGGEQTIMTGFHNLARPLTFTVSFDGSYFLISYDNNTKTARYPNYQNITSVDEIKDSTNISNGTWSGPVVERFSSRWEMQIAFNNTGNNNSWRGLIGNVYNGLNDGANRAWGIWINNTNTIIVSPYSDSVLKAPTLWETALVVAQNVNYVFRVTKMLTTMTLSLTNLSTNAIQTSTLTLTASDIWGMHGSVTVGGWLAGFGPDSETFVGPITEVSVFPAFASSTVSGNSVTFAVPFLDAELPLSLVAVAKANSNGRVSVNSVVQNILSQYAVPIKASDPVYTESSGSYAATMTYTVTSGVTSLQVRRASDSSVVTGVTTSVTGITATITVPFTDALNFVVVALTNSSGRESAASVAQTIVPVPIVEFYSYINDSGTTKFILASSLAVGSYTPWNSTDKVIFVPNTSASRLVVFRINRTTLPYTQTFIQESNGDADYTYSNARRVIYDSTSNTVVLANTGKHCLLIYYFHNGLLTAPGVIPVRSPRAVAFDRSGNIIVAINETSPNAVDAIPDQIRTYSTNGVHLNTLISQVGTTAGTINKPMNLSVDSVGNIIVGCLNGVQIFTSSGVFITRLPNTETFSLSSSSFGGTSATVDPQNDNRIIAINANNHVLYLFEKDSSGNWYSNKSKQIGAISVPSFDGSGNIYAFGSVPGFANYRQLRHFKITDFTISNVVENLPQFAVPILDGSISYSGNTASMTYTVTSGVTAVSVVKSDLSELPSDASVTTNTVSGTTATIAITFATSFSFVVIAEGNSTGNESGASATQTLIKQFDAPIIVNVSYSERTVGNYTALTATLACTVKPEVSSVKLLKSDLTAISDTTLALPSSFVTRIGSSNWRQYIPMQNPGNTDMQFWTADAQFHDVNVAPHNEIAKQFSYFAGYWLNAKRASSGQSFSVNVSNGTMFEFTATEDYPVTSYTGQLYGAANVVGVYNLTAQSDGIAAGIAVSGGVKIMNLAASSGSASPKVIFVLSVALPLNVVVVAEGNAFVQESAASVAQTLIIGEVTKYVSVGRDFGTVNKNSIAYSVDGLNWTSVANNIFTDYGAAVHHSAKLPRWVAVGQGTNSIAHSINGANWIPVTNSTTIFSGSGRGVAYSTKLSRWVAVGGGTNNIAHSTDGINWVGLGTNQFTGGGGLGVSYSAELSRWVAVGHGTNTSTIVHSTDGINWNEVANSTSIFSEAGLGVAHGGSKWVAVGQGINSIAHSTDGITWYGVANSTSIFSERGQGVAYSFQLSRWVAVGRGTNTIAYSIDGVTWTPVTNSTSIFQTVGHSVLYNSEQSRWVAVGGATAGGSTTIAYSTNGINWTAVPNSVSVFDGTGIGIATLLTQFAAPTLTGSISYSGNTASMTYTVNAGVTEVSVLQADLTPLPVGTTVTTNVVSGTTATLVISSVNSLVFVVVAQSNSTGNESVASATQTFIKQFTAPVLSSGISYSGSTASMTYTVDSGVTALRVVKSDLSALPSDASVTTNAVSGTTATIAITFATSFSFVVIAEGNSNGRESTASVTPSSLSIGAFSPRLTSVITYSGNTASMTYAVAYGVTAVQVRNASDNSVVSGVTSSVNSLTATITVPYSANISIVVVANSSGQESAPSTILIVGPTRFPAPTSQNSSTALVNNIYTTTTTCQVASGVTAIQANSASATTSVSGTTATIVYASDSTPTSVCALGNGASATSTPANLIAAASIPKIRISGYDGKVTNSITYNATFGSSGTGAFGFNAPRGIAHLYVNTGTSSVPVIRRFLFVSNTGSNNVKVYSNASSNASSLSYHSAISSFNTPSQIACYHKNDSGGVSLRMAIADSGNHRVVIYNLVVDAYGVLTINLAVELGSYGSGAPSTVAPQFNNPQGVAYSRIGTLFIADTNNHRIQVVDSSNSLTSTILGAYGTNNGQLNYPTSLAVNALNNVIVGCQNGVQIFTSSGTFVTKISTIVSPSVAVDNAGVGKIIVTNPALNQLHVFSSGGVQMFTMFGGSGQTNGLFNNPSGVTVDNYGNIYVCDRDNHRIQYFESIQVSFFAPMLSSGIAYSGTTASMRYTVAAEASTMEVRKASDNTVISGATYVINGTTANITVPLTTADAPLSIVVVALTNQGVVSAASATLTLVAHFAPALSSSVTYSGNTASMTYTVATGVTGVQVRKASDNTGMSGATYIINGTTATITVPLTDTVNVVVVSLIYQVVSAASVQQTLVAQFAAPTILNSVTYSGNTASMTYTVATGVTGVEVRNASDNSVMSRVTTSSINSLIATITVTLANDVNIVVVAQANTVGRESVASVIQPLTLQPFALAALLIANGDTIKYIGTANIVPEYTPLFIQSNPRGNGMEWFAVVSQSMKNAISEYASGTDGPFKPTPQLPAVPWNNIVTTLMTNMSSLFFNRLTFNQPIGSWDTSNVTNMDTMFRNTLFNQAIGAWNTSAVTTMDSMFADAIAFNQAIGAWNTSAVKRMFQMFMGADAFNQPIGAWNTSAVTNMSSMFYSANAFNQPIGAWNTSEVDYMDIMFYYASAFNQNISAWVVEQVPFNIHFRTGSALSYDNTPPKFR